MGTISDSILGGLQDNFFLLTLYNSKNIGGGLHVLPLARPPAPRSLRSLFFISDKLHCMIS